MKITKDYLEKNLHKFLVPIEISIDDVEILGVEILRRDSINDNTEHDQSRQHDDISSRATQLEHSYRVGGIDFTKPLPIVNKREDGVYDRIDSYGRDAAFQNLGIDYYPFLIVNCKDYMAETKLRLWANRTLPKTDNAERDIIAKYIDLYSKKFVGNTEKEIIKFVNDVEPHRQKESKDRIITSIKNKLKTKKPKNKTWTYSAAQIQTKWIDRHWQSAPTYGFFLHKKKPLLNPQGNVYQISMTFGYEPRKIIDAIKRYVSEGIPTEVICNVSTSTSSKKSLDKKRLAIKNNIKKIQSNLDKLYGKNKQWNRIIKFLGFVPQHIDEDIKNLIPFDSIK
jgi:hypothetical protein